MSASKRKALGKGLGALIPVSDKKSTGKPKDGLFHCPVDKLDANAEQPRQSFDQAKLAELTESILSKGIIEPLVVRATGAGRFQIVAGERRWRAARLAGLSKVPVVVKDLSDSEMLEIALIENIQREDLNPLEEAEAYRQLIEEHGLTQEKLAKRVGRQRSTVANALRLLKLPDEIQRHLMTGELSMGHARAILGIDGQSARMAVARKVVREGLSVRACEDLVRQQTGGSKKSSAPAKSKKALKPAERQLVDNLQRRLGTKVDLQQGRKGGKLVVHYYSNDELSRIIDVINED